MEITMHRVSKIDITSKRSQLSEQSEPYDVYHIKITDIDGQSEVITCFGDFGKTIGLSIIDSRHEEPE